MSTPSKRRALGRGLSALLPGNDSNSRPTDEGSPAGDPTLPAAELPPRQREYFRAQIEDLYPNPDQPRRHFDDAEMDELAQSIRIHGILQPLIVRTRPKGDGNSSGSGYFLIAGERRWRAAQRAGLHQVPVVVQEASPTEAFERALVENLQRADLNAIEEAEAYKRLVEEFSYTQEQIAERVGKDRSTVANSLRLLRLPNSVRQMVEDGSLKMGHARALLPLEDDVEEVARRVVENDLSVRATERLVKEQTKPQPAPGTPETASTPSDDTDSAQAAEGTVVKTKRASVRDLEDRMRKSLGAEVIIDEHPSGTGGQIRIRYLDLDHLDQLLERLLPS